MKGETENLFRKAVILATIIGLTSLGAFLGISLILRPDHNDLGWFICPSIILELLVFVVMTVPKLNQKSKDFDRLYATVRKIVVNNTEGNPLSRGLSLEEEIKQLEKIVEHGLEREKMVETLLTERSEYEQTTEKQFDNLERIIYRLVGSMMKVIVRVWNRGHGGSINFNLDESRSLRRELGREVLRALIAIRASEREIIGQFDDTRLLSDLVASAARHHIIEKNSLLFVAVSAVDLERKVAREAGDVPAEPPPVDQRAKLTAALKARQASNGPQDPGRTSSDETDPGDTRP